MKTTIKQLFIVAACLPMLAACGEHLLATHEPTPSRWDTDSDADLIILGNKLDDPYSITNMSKAFERLYPTKAERLPLEPTHNYIRFLPKTEAEYNELLSLGIQILDHPVDYEIVKEGNYYHDPELDKEQITWQYAVLPLEEALPQNIRYEILYQCYIPYDDSPTKADGIDWSAVEDEAYHITGNSHLMYSVTKASEGSSPNGSIKIKDSKLGDELVGLKGVKVSCNTFVKFDNAFTDEDGNYKMNKRFKSNPRYRIVFQNKYGFAIGFNLILAPASACNLGNHPAEGFSIIMDSSSDRTLFTRSVVNNAAYDYFKSCKTKTSSISTPPANLRIWIFKHLELSTASMLHQGVLVDGGLVSKYLGEVGAFLIKLFLPDITLGLKYANEYSDIYSATLHELAHSSHFSQVGKDYWTHYATHVLKSFVSSGFVHYGAGTEDDHGYTEIGEMWAYYLQNIMYRERYKAVLSEEEEENIFGTGFWFHPQILMYLEDRGLTRYKIFAAYTKDIKDREMLQKKLISLNPQFKTAINQAFSRYN